MANKSLQIRAVNSKKGRKVKELFENTKDVLKQQISAQITVDKTVDFDQRSEALTAPLQQIDEMEEMLYRRLTDFNVESNDNGLGDLERIANL
mmetsp:Transcript_17381/g.29243  ORF Transcript_17381/g.29243 Transcript_17381/m.29243 type:complete len:93 (+) Transcript_17381:1303-1581(+)